MESFFDKSCCFRKLSPKPAVKLLLEGMTVHNRLVMKSVSQHDQL